MRRGSPDAEGPSNERWLVSYADFVTVLFGFFVFMYAISTAEDDQVRRLSEAVHGVFAGPPRALDPITVGEAVPRIPERLVSESRNDQAGMSEALRQELGSVLGGDAGADGIRLRKGGNWVEVTLPGDLVFNSGGVEPGFEGVEALERIAGVLSEHDGRIVVEGFTDNLPIQTERFPSNWELSAARAGAVVRVLEAFGIEGSRLAAMGYGSNHPVARNDTERGRSLNRRVVLLIAEEGAPMVPPGGR